MSPAEWFASLSDDHKELVREWAAMHPSPVGWQGTWIEWAHTEMPDPRSGLGRALLSMTWSGRKRAAQAPRRPPRRA